MEESSKTNVEVDLMTSGDKKAVSILIRSSQPIPTRALSGVLAHFSKQLEDQAALQESKILTQKKTLILP